MDHHVRHAITSALRLRGVDVLTAQDDGTQKISDPELLDRSTALGRVLFSQDKDLLREATRRQQTTEHFAGVIYAHQIHVSIRPCIEDLELIAKVGKPEDFAGRVEYLPL
jgi:uncharacterized protein with PIN domain